MTEKKQNESEIAKFEENYGDVLSSMVELLEESRRTSARAVNSIMTATYWEIGRRIVELEQQGKDRAEYGKQFLRQLATDLTSRFGRGFSVSNLEYMRRFYACWSIPQTLSGKSQAKLSTESQSTETTGLTGISTGAGAFPLPWSHYIKLMSVADEDARKFYEEESLRGGWSVRQLKRQIGSLFYERTLLSKNKGAMLEKGATAISEDTVGANEEIKDPLVLEFLDLKDEYSESDLENALVLKLEEFLLELGGDFAFVGRQRRLRIGDAWYRVDLLFFHRKLKCLVVIDLKIGEFGHADAGQMHMYLNYAAEHWTNPDENPPVGLILCAHKNDAVARYALDGLPNQVMAAEYKLALPDEDILAAELAKTQRALQNREPKTDSESPKT